MIMMSFSSIGLISILWLFYGFAFAFGPNETSSASNFIGDPSTYWGWLDLSRSGRKAGEIKREPSNQRSAVSFRCRLQPCSFQLG